MTPSKRCDWCKAFLVAGDDGPLCVGCKCTIRPKPEDPPAPKPRPKRKSTRAHGEGSISRDTERDGFIAVVSFTGDDGRIKRKKRRCATEKEALRELTKLRSEIAAGDVVDDRMTVEAWLTKWLAEFVCNSRPSTQQSYAQQVKKHLGPGLGGHPLARLSALQVNAFLKAKLAEGLSPRSVQYLHSILRAALEEACRLGIAGGNVAKRVRAPSVPKREAACMTTDQARRLLAAADADPLCPLFAMALTMGLRRGELVGLSWDDVDLEARVLRVRHQVQRVKGKGLVVSDLKTDLSRRALEIPAFVVAKLRKHKSEQSARALRLGKLWEGRGFVFCTELGRPIDGRFVLKCWQRALKGAGLPVLPFHASRHTAASVQLAQGAELRSVMGMLGHSQIALTANTYSHVLEEVRRGTAARAEAAFGGNSFGNSAG